MNNPVFRQFSIRMSKPRMADVLYAVIMCNAEITSTFGVGIYQYDKSQNYYNAVDIMIKIDESQIDKFIQLTHVQLHEPQKVQVN